MRQHADAGGQPLARRFHVYGRVVAIVRCNSLRTGERRRAVLDGNVRTDETDRVDVDVELAAGVLGKEGRKRILDRLAALEEIATFVDVFGVGREMGGDGLCVSRGVGLGVGLARLADGSFVGRVLILGNGFRSGRAGGRLAGVLSAGLTTGFSAALTVAAPVLVVGLVVACWPGAAEQIAASANEAADTLKTACMRILSSR